MSLAAFVALIEQAIENICKKMGLEKKAQPADQNQSQQSGENKSKEKPDQKKNFPNADPHKFQQAMDEKLGAVDAALAAEAKEDEETPALFLTSFGARNLKNYIEYLRGYIPGALFTNRIHIEQINQELKKVEDVLQADEQADAKALGNINGENKAGTITIQEELRLKGRKENLQGELKNLQEEMKDLKAALVLLFDLGKKYQWLADNPEFFHYFLLEKNRLQAESTSKSDQTHKPPVQQSQDLKQGSELRDLAKTVLSTENIREILRDKNGKHGKRLPKIEEIYRKKAGIAETARHMDKLMDDRFGGDHSEQILINGLNAYFAGKAGVNPKRTQEDGGLVGLVKRGFDLKDPKQVAVDLKKIFEEQARKFRESWARRILEKSVLAQPKAASKAAQENKKKSPPANAVKPKEESEPQVVPGSTAIGALYSPNDKILTLVNAGDSRAVAIIMNQDQSAVKDVVRLTCDHKPQNPDEKLRIKGLGGRVVGNKIFFKKGDYLDCEISVSRSAGDSDAVNSHGEHLVSSEFEVFQYEAALMCKEKGDQVLLLLTCDGPYEVVNEKTLQVLLEWWAESKDVREQWENNLADYIISWAIILGSCDNNSAFVVDLFKCNKAFFAGIFDGHGGHQASQYLTENIAKHLLDLDQEKFKAFLPRPSLAVENPSGSKAASAKGLVVASV